MNTSLFMSNFKSLLADIDTDLYQDNAPKTAKTPYIVFRLETTIDQSPSYTLDMKFMCYDDQNKSSKDNIIIADEIQKIFNKQYWVLVGQSLHSTLTLRQNIPSEMLIDKQVIELQFDMTLYERGE